MQISDQFVPYVLSHLVPLSVNTALTGSTVHPCSPQPVRWLTELCWFTVPQSGDKTMRLSTHQVMDVHNGVEANLFTPETSQVGGCQWWALLFNRFILSRTLRVSDRQFGGSVETRQFGGSVEKKDRPSQTGLVPPSWGPQLFSLLTQLLLLNMWHNKLLIVFRCIFNSMTKILWRPI
jgi:hypothetical protein